MNGGTIVVKFLKEEDTIEGWESKMIFENRI